MVAYGTISESGTLGDWSRAVDVHSGRFVTRSSFHLYAVSSGYDGRNLWKQDRSGTSHRLDAPFSRADALTQSWLLRRGYFEASGARYSYIGQGRVGGHAVLTLIAVPSGGNPVILAFDEASHLLLQVTRQLPYRSHTETYSDYRRVGRALMPFRIEGGEGPGTTIAVARYGPSEETRVRFAPPPRPNDTRISASVSVPLDGRSYPVISASVNGVEFDFIVDTGGHNILTPAAASKLALAVDGRSSSTGAGTATVVQRDARVRELRVGGATLSDQHFYVIDLGLAVERKDQPPLGGILGLELLQRVAVTFDVPRRTFATMPFTAAPCEGDRVPIRFDDDMPVAAGSVDGLPGQVGIDTGNGGLPIVLWRWATANGVAGNFLRGGATKGSGLGGTSPLIRSSPHELAVGRTQMANTEVAYSQDRAGAFSSRTEAVNIGHALLSQFAVTFDYSRRMMCISRGAGTNPGVNPTS